MDQDVFGFAVTGGDGRVFISTSGVVPRVYAFSTSTGQLLNTIYDPDGQGGAFGTGATYGDGSLLVANPSYTINPQLREVGRAYLFDAMTGQMQRALSNPQPKTGDGFGSGWSLAVEGSSVVVGALSDDLPGDNHPDGDNPGRVWVLDRLSGNEINSLDNPNPDKPPPLFLMDWFGWNVRSSREIIVVGAQEDDSAGPDGSGTVYIFNRNSGELKHTLFSPQLETNGEFGRSIALSKGNKVLVGAWNTSVNGIPGAGRTYLFDGATGNLLMEIVNPEATAFSGFGWSVALDDDGMLISADAADPEGISNAGAVYVFEAIPEPTSVEQAIVGVLLFVLATRRTVPWSLLSRPV
jgi:hypothetical protein